jgi:hypothetical protein
MKKPLLTTLIAVSFWGAACATEPLDIQTPTRIADERTGGIAAGVTTRTELLALFGEPEMKIPSEDGMTYFWKDENLSSLWVLFAEDWTVADFVYSE